MTLTRVTRVIYCLFGIVYILIGAGSILLPTGWLPQSVTNDMLAGEIRGAFVQHLLQEFGTVVLALGFVFLWYATREKLSRSLHWAITFYFSLDALIHWIGPQGLIGSWPRGIVNSIPFGIMVLLGLLRMRDSERMQMPGAA